MSPNLQSVEIVTEPDPDPDLSYIGEYSSETGPEDRTIDRQERGDMGRGEHRYFIATHGPEETGNADSVEEDYQAMEAFNRDEWGVIGLYAEAVVNVNGTRQTIRSGGLWGVVTDSSAAHLEETARDELHALRHILGRLGVRDPSEPLKATWAEDAPLSGTLSEGRNHPWGSDEDRVWHFTPHDENDNQPEGWYVGYDQGPFDTEEEARMAASSGRGGDA